MILSTTMLGALSIICSCHNLSNLYYLLSKVKSLHFYLIINLVEYVENGFLLK